MGNNTLDSMRTENVKLAELVRRLSANGFECALGASGRGFVGELDDAYFVRGENDDEIAFVNPDSSVQYPARCRDFANKVAALRDEVEEYTTAYRNAAPDDTARTLIKYNNCELAATRTGDRGFEFVTWRLDRNGERETGHYTGDYNDAKRSFLVRSGLIDGIAMFSQRELLTIRVGLLEYLALDECDGNADEDTVADIIWKIDDVIGPEAQNDDEDDYEPEEG